MAAPKKKSPKKASQLFEGIIKASVSGNPKPKAKEMVLEKLKEKNER